MGHGSANGNNADYGQTLQLQRSSADGPLAARLSGWFARLAGSTNDLSLAWTVGGALSHSVSTASALASSTSRKGGSGDGGSKTGLLDKAVRYLLDGDAAA